MSNHHGYYHLYYMRNQCDSFYHFFDYQHQWEEKEMTDTKRKTKTSSAVKQRYNEKVYDIVSARVPKDLAAAFREKCMTSGISQAQIIKNAIEAFLAE